MIWPLVIGRKEPEPRGEQRGGVERVGVVVLPEDAAAVDAAFTEVEDEQLAGACHVHFVRSAVAYARIVSSVTPPEISSGTSFWQRK